MSESLRGLKVELVKNYQFSSHSRKSGRMMKDKPFYKLLMNSHSPKNWLVAH